MRWESNQSNAMLALIHNSFRRRQCRSVKDEKQQMKKRYCDLKGITSDLSTPDLITLLYNNTPNPNKYHMNEN